METHPDVEFDHFLATELGKSVAEIRQLDNDEWVSWNVYYQRKAQREELEQLKAKTSGKG